MIDSIYSSSAARSVVSALLLCVGATGTGCSASAGSEEEAPAVTHQEIINGTVDTRNIAVVGLMGPRGSIYGTGTIVDVNTHKRTAYVLTAAHAALTTPYAIVYDDARGQRVQMLGTAQASRVHPEYLANSDRRFDVAVFEVSGADASTPAIPVLPSSLDGLIEGASIEFSAWGRFDEAGRVARTRHRMSKPLLSVDSTMVHWDNSGAMGSCSGDSGGAAIRVFPTGPAVVGVYHGRSGDAGEGENCNQPGSIGDAVRVQNVRSWINQNIVDLRGPECVGATSSIADTQCPANQYCDDGGLLRGTQRDDLNICAPRKENGATCLRDRVCASNHCSVGFCRP